MQKKGMKKGIIFILIMTLVCSLATPVQAATIKISATKLTMKVGQSQKLTVNTNKKVSKQPLRQLYQGKNCVAKSL